MTGLFIGIVIALVLSALFSGVEIAFISANKLKLELDKKQGVFSAKVLSSVLKNQSKFITAMLLGNNIALVIYGILMAKMIEPLIQHWVTNGMYVLLIQTIISTLVVLVFAEFLPKALLRINPNMSLKALAIPLKIIYFVLFPFTIFTIGVSSMLLKFFDVDTNDEDYSFSKLDLEHYVTDIQEQNEASEMPVENEIQMFSNALEISKMKARESMIPRTEIVAVEIESDISVLKQRFKETKLSRILIYRDNIDNIIGYTHQYELFKKPASIKSILLPISVVPESMPTNEIMQLLISKKRNIVVVLDEFGGTSGIITLEDIIEEILGEIHDEHDKERFVAKQIDDNHFQFSARLEVDYVNNKYKINIPESEAYETIAGFVLSLCEDIPQKNLILEHENMVIRVDEVAENKIELVTLEFS